MTNDKIEPDPKVGGGTLCGAQRLSFAKLHEWQSLQYGMFLTFGMSTFEGHEISLGKKPSSFYAPDQLDVDQWIQVARDAGMKYAVLTTKHVSGHCLWPSEHTDYHIGTSSNKQDVVGKFVEACARHNIVPGFYYCSWDNHHRFGSGTPSFVQSDSVFTTRKYLDFQMAQMEELLTRYGPIGEVWIDIARVLGHDGRRQQYEQIALLQPEAVIMMNSFFRDGSRVFADENWPTDLMVFEQRMPYTPKREGAYCPWYEIEYEIGNKRDYYIPGEVCMTLGENWFYAENDKPRGGGQMLGMRLICAELQTNLLLNVPPDCHGVIPKQSIDALQHLRRNWERNEDLLPQMNAVIA